MNSNVKSTMNKEKEQSLGKSFTTLLTTLAIGMLIGAGITYRYVSTNYFEVHNSNIGGFIFKGGKVYSLEELKDF